MTELLTADSEATALEALRSHQSQVAKRDEESDLRKMMGEWGERVAQMAEGRLAEGRLAEAFRVIDTK